MPVSAAVARIGAASFPDARFLDARAATALLSSLAAQRISGGAVYDALVAAAAVQHDALLATRDVRALDTYRALSARIEVLR